MHFVEHIVDCHFIITLWYWFHMSSYSCTDGDVMLDAAKLRLVKHTSPNWLTSCSPIVRISLLITANLQIFPDSRFHRYTSINNHSNFDSNSTMTIHLAIQSELLIHYHLSLHGLLVAIRPRSAMIHNHQPNLTHQLLKIKCLWWHNPNMTACIFSMSSYSCTNGDEMFAAACTLWLGLDVDILIHILLANSS